MEFLARAITFLSRHFPDRWGVTLLEHKDVVRLNVGWVECLVLHPGGLRVLVERENAPRDTKFDGRPYRYAPGCKMTAIPLSDLPRSLPKLVEANQKALAIAARRPSPRNILGAHATGVTEWLSQWSAALCRTRRAHRARSISFKAAFRTVTRRSSPGCRAAARRRACG